MTAQAPEILIVESGSIALPEMKLYGIAVGNPDDPKSCKSYQFLTKGSEDKMTLCTALWRGYISTYRLKADGTLILEKLEYPFSKGAEPDEVSEVLQGEFWLDLRESFMGDGVMIPFINGIVVADKTQWKRREGYSAERFQRELDEKNCAALSVVADQSVPQGMKGYKVYLNGNVYATPPRFSHLAPDNGLYTRVSPGSYRIVVREFNNSKNDRMESNTMHIEMTKNETRTLRLFFIENKLKLEHSDA